MATAGNEPPARMAIMGQLAEDFPFENPDNARAFEDFISQTYQAWRDFEAHKNWGEINTRVRLEVGRGLKITCSATVEREINKRRPLH